MIDDHVEDMGYLAEQAVRDVATSLGHSGNRIVISALRNLMNEAKKGQNVHHS